jgi:rSAM/selenodomain-associated transferase 1
MRRRVTAIVFTREPVVGSVKTRLIPRIGAANAAALADAFARDAMAKARELRMPLVLAGGASGGAERSRYLQRLASRFEADLVDQGGGHLGARMRRALEPYAREGAILIGADTPSIPSAIIARGAALLREAPVVLGPSLDGGYYLIGVRGAMPDIFRGVRWGGGQVLEQTLARLRRGHARYALAPSWYDVDRWSDLMLLGAHLAILIRRGVNPCPQSARLLARLGLLPGRR